jgi:hypothetical protein
MLAGLCGHIAQGMLDSKVKKSFFLYMINCALNGILHRVPRMDKGDTVWTMHAVGGTLNTQFTHCVSFGKTLNIDVLCTT